MEKTIRQKLLQRSFTSTWKPRFVEYFAVCGLGTQNRRVETEGRFHVLSQGHLEGQEPFCAQLIDRFPAEDHRKLELPQMLPSVVLPYGVRVYPDAPSPDNPDSMPKAFPAVLTDTKGIKIYVAALRFRDQLDEFLIHTHKLAPGSYADKCICIVSHYPFIPTFLGMLTEVHRLCFQEGGCPRPIWHMIESMTRIPVPKSMNTVYRFSMHRAGDCFRIQVPENSSPRNLHVSYHALVESLDIESILRLFAAALVERKILIKGDSLALLTDVAEALVSLLYPIKWMPVYVPLLPVDALECLDAPVTYIYGVCSADVDIDFVDLDKVVVADLDNSTVEMVYAEGRRPSAEELADYTMYGIPELPKKAAQKLRRSLRNLIRPRASTIMTVPHAKSRQEAEDLDLQVGLSDERWGPRHEERFQLAFLRFMAELLKGVRSFLTRGDTNVSEDDALCISPRETFNLFEDQFLAAKLEEFGRGAEQFFKLLMVTCGWSGYVTDESREALSKSSMFGDFMAAVGTPEEARLKLPGGCADMYEVELEPETFRMLDPGVKSLSRLEEEEGAQAELQVYTRFPESETSALAGAREKEKLKMMRKMETRKMEEEQVRMELLKLDYMARVHHHLDLLAQDPAAAGSLADMQKIIETCQAEEALSDCFILCMAEHFEAEQGVEPRFFEACRDLLSFALDVIQQEKDYATVGMFLDISRKILLQGSAEKEGEPHTMRKALRGLDIWRDRRLWEHLFQLGLDNWGEGDTKSAEIEVNVMQELVRLMTDVGLSIAEIGDVVERLCGSLSIKSQILLREQVLELQVLIHPQARMFVSALEKGNWNRSCLPKSKSSERWMSAVGNIKKGSKPASKTAQPSGLPKPRKDGVSFADEPLQVA